MSEENKKILEALKNIREAESKRETKRKFEQTVDLIINLKDFDVRRSSFNTFVELPNRIKEKKIAGFFEKDSKLIEVIKKEEFPRYKEKRDSKRLIKKYDNFIANAKLMPSIATAFGRVLGPAGKMPSPQMGIVPNEDEKTVQDLLKKINSSVRVTVKEPSLKIGIAKESLNDEAIAQNILAVYRKLSENLPKGKDNIRNIKIKFTMGKPITIHL